MARRRRRRTRQALALSAATLCALLAGTPSVSRSEGRPARQQARSTERCSLPGSLRGAFLLAARDNRLPVGLLISVARVESGLSAGARSDKGAIGVMQLMPATARALAYDPFDTTSNVMAGAIYLRQLLSHYNNDLPLALAAYNAGPTAVDRAGGPPSDDTSAYVNAVEVGWDHTSCTI